MCIHCTSCECVHLHVVPCFDRDACDFMKQLHYTLCDGLCSEFFILRSLHGAGRSISSRHLFGAWVKLASLWHQVPSVVKSSFFMDFRFYCGIFLK